MTKIIYKLNKKVILISLLIIGLFVAILFTFTHSKELSESDTISLEVEEESLGTYYLKVTYDGIDKKGQDSKNNNETEIFSDDIKVSDVLPPGIIFNGFEETIDGTIGAKYENGKMCPGRVVDDSGENFTTISGYDAEGNEIQVYSTYHGLHYDEETITISFIVRGLKAGCNLEVGIGIKHPSLEGRLRRDFYNTALVNEKKQSAVSNYLHTWMGLKDVDVYKVKYEFENLDEELINLTSNLLPRYEIGRASCRKECRL